MRASTREVPFAGGDCKDRGYVFEAKVGVNSVSIATSLTTRDSIADGDEKFCIARFLITNRGRVCPVDG
jgi:hypothetical protein